MDVFGVDFSGARDAGAKTWVAEATATGGELRVERCASLADRVGTADRAPCLAALRSLLREADVAGLDVSFGLPAAVHDHDDWRSLLAWFPGPAASADAFQARCRDRARSLPGDGVDLKRATDRDTGASSPYGFVTYKQTFHALRDVLAPLVREGGVAVPPMTGVTNEGDASDGPDGAGDVADASADVTLCEVYPAATLRRLGLPDERYKRCEGARERRERILAGLREEGLVPGPEAAGRARSDAGGDALDALVAALAAWRAARQGFAPQGPCRAVEGHIYR